MRLYVFVDDRLDKDTLGLLCYCLHAQAENERISIGKLRNRFPGTKALKKNLSRLKDLGYAICYPEKKLAPTRLVYEFFDEPLAFEELDLYEDLDD